MIENAAADEVAPDEAGRGAAMALCARAADAELARALDAVGPIPPSRDLRAPQTGLVMLRGRAGGDGAAFNLGEATVTRAAVVVEAEGDAGDGDAAGGTVGFAYHLGRDGAKARRAALLDALWQIPARRGAVERALEAVRGRLAEEEARDARRTAATRVNFFTLARGED